MINWNNTLGQENLLPWNNSHRTSLDPFRLSPKKILFNRTSIRLANYRRREPLRCVPLKWSGSGSVIQDHSHHGASKEPMNPWPEQIHRFEVWCTMVRVILERWSWSRPHKLYCFRTSHRSMETKQYFRIETTRKLNVKDLPRFVVYCHISIVRRALHIANQIARLLDIHFWVG